MNLTQLKSQLQASIPEELYKIEPGQIVVLTPQEGLTEQTASNLSDLFHTFSHFGFGEQIKLQVLPTDKPELLGAIVGRKEYETGSPYNIIISDNQSLVGFLAEYFSLDFEEFTTRAKSSILSRMRLKPEQRPIIFPIDPDDCPTKQQVGISGCSLCPYMEDEDFGGMQALSTKKQPQEELENKISYALADCERFAYDVDTTTLKNKVRTAWKQPVEYNLILDLQYKARRKGYAQSEVLGVCDIYIEGAGEKHKINIRPAEKALYLTNILRGGFPLNDMSMDVLKDMADIFSKIPDRQEREKGIKTLQQSLSGIGVMKKRIKDAFAVAIDFGPDVDKFAMEGFVGKKVSIRKATDKHREQIKKYFGL